MIGGFPAVPLKKLPKANNMIDKGKVILLNCNKKGNGTATGRNQPHHKRPRNSWLARKKALQQGQATAVVPDERRGGKIRAYPEIIHNSLPASFPADFVAFSCRASQHTCKKSPCLPKNLTVQSAYALFRDRLLLCWNQKNPMKGGLT